MEFQPHTMKLLKMQLDNDTKRRAIKLALCALLPANQADHLIGLARQTLAVEVAPTCQPE